MELKRLLDAIEDEDTDLDDLSLHVERAADLIRLCRQRIFHTEMKVQQVISQLDDDPSDPSDN
jgi:exodeoxyribonuclease VII small subunit